MGKKETVADFATKRLLATVSGMKIYSDSIYVITGKMDESAPSGFQERGISKVPFPGNKNVVYCPWDKNLNTFDTGFYINSKCYQGMTRNEAEDEMNMRIKNIEAPFAESTNADLSASNTDFWEVKGVDCYDGRLFYTNDIRDLFDLYIALQVRALTPKEEDGNPEFQNSYYIVEDKTTAVDVRKQRQLDKTEIIYKFMSMLNGNPQERQKLYDLLLYLDIIHTVEIDPSMVQYIFTNWIEQKSTNIDNYKSAQSRFLAKDESLAGPQIIMFHRMIKEMMYAGIVKISTTGVTFNNDVIGSDAISAAIAVVENKDLVERKAQLLEAYNAMKKKHDKIDAGNYIKG